MSFRDAAVAALKDAPPVGVGGAVLFGVSLSTWVMLATLLYTLLRIWFLIEDHLDKKKEKARVN